MPALVLVADADPFELRLLSELCSTLGFDVVTAADGGGVLDAVARDRPRLVVMDRALPGLDGLKVLEILKADPGLRHVPVVLATTHEDSDARRRGLELGAADYVTKPYRTFELHERLHAVLRLRSVRESGAPPPAPASTERGGPALGAGTASQLLMSLEYEFTRAARYEHPLACIVVRCADRADSIAGAESEAAQAPVIVLAEMLRGCIRSVDHVFRSGVHEFTILLPETGPLGCEAVLGRLRACDAQARAAGMAAPGLVVGTASYPRDRAASGEALWRAALDAVAASRVA